MSWVLGMVSCVLPLAGGRNWVVLGWPAQLPRRSSPSTGKRPSCPVQSRILNQVPLLICAARTHVSERPALFMLFGFFSQALECDFVSANLHHWIDLIFGYKQQGPAAVEAVNTFHPYFYGDKIDLGSIGDPLIRNTILGFVSNFGQVPKQVQCATSFVFLSQHSVCSVSLEGESEDICPGMGARKGATEAKSSLVIFLCLQGQGFTLSYHVMLMMTLVVKTPLMIRMKAAFICDVYDRHCDNSQDLVLHMYLPSRVVVKVQ